MRTIAGRSTRWKQICLLRAQSVRGQLDGEFPDTLREQAENPGAGVDASDVRLTDLGDFADLEEARDRQDAARQNVQARTDRSAAEGG